MNTFGEYEPPDVIVIGTCSLCGGAVVTPRCIVVRGTNPEPVRACCASCGAVQRVPVYGAIIDMVKEPTP